MPSRPKVLLAGVEPGGAQCVAAVARHLLAEGFPIAAIAQGPGIGRFEALGVACESIDSSVAPESMARMILDRERPDVILTGTSMGNFLERHLWVEAARRGIPCAAVLDAWVNIGVRFTWADYASIESIDPVDSGSVLPDAVFCPDVRVAERLGSEAPRIANGVVTGHPWIEWCQGRHRFDPTATEESPRRILFLSEPLLQDFGRRKWGFGQDDVLRMVADAISGELRSGKIELVVRPHPREDRRILVAAMESSGGKGWRWADPGEALEQATKSHLACGISTMALLEAWACGCPILSILPGLTGESPFLPDRMGWEPALRDPSLLREAILDRLAAPPTGIPATFRHQGASENIMEELVGLADFRP